MANHIIYNAISVFQDKKGHILIFDRLFPPGRLDTYYFDIHECKKRVITPLEAEKELTEVLGSERERACEIYLNWKLYAMSALVISEAEKYFPVHRTPDTSSSNIMDSEKKAIKPNKPVDVDPAARGRAIKKFIMERNVTTLIHFTHVSNLESILKMGLVSRRKVDQLPIRSTLVVNDQKRLDDHVETVSLSISFPNYKMFNIYKREQEEWVVIGLKPDILWELDCLFYASNAASREYRYISDSKLRQTRSLKKIFADYMSVQRQDLCIPDWFPTNPQAEVLVMSDIPTSYLLRVNFFNQTSYASWMKDHPNLFPTYMTVEPDFFYPRCDYRHWSNQARVVNESPDTGLSDEVPF